MTKTALPPQRTGSIRGGNLGTFVGSGGTNTNSALTEMAVAAAEPRWRWLAVGWVAAIVLKGLLPGPFLWVLCVIPHEMGHATMGCLLGHPSAPAISLSGHAWTGVRDLQPWLVWAITAGFGITTWLVRQRTALVLASAAATILIPLCAFTRLAPILIAAGGHLGELAFAAYCYAVIWTGGRTGSTQERVAGAVVGGMLQWANLTLCFGLLTNAAARAEYASNGSLGLKNDYLVLAEDLLGCGLGAVAFTMLLIALLPLPVGFALGRWQERHQVVDHDASY
jgi:hypothetical protein